MSWGLKELRECKNKLSQMVEDEDFTLRGKSGACFIKDGEVLKVYERPIIKEKKCDMSKYTSSCIAFPKYYIKSNKKYYAEVMKYIPSSVLYNALCSGVNLKEMLNHYYEIIKEIKKYNKIHMTDLGFHGNILYSDEKGFYLIDTTDWNDEEWSCTEKANIRSFNRSLFEAFRLYLFGDEYYNYDELYIDIKKMYYSVLNTKDGIVFFKCLEDNITYNYNFESFIISFINLVEKYYTGSILTSSDVKNHVKVLKSS